MGPIVTEETYQKMPTKEAAEKAHWICRQIKVLTKEAIGELEFETEMFEGMIEILQKELRKIDLPRSEQ